MKLDVMFPILIGVVLITQMVIAEDNNDLWLKVRKDRIEMSKAWLEKEKSQGYLEPAEIGSYEFLQEIPSFDESETLQKSCQVFWIVFNQSFDPQGKAHHPLEIIPSTLKGFTEEVMSLCPRQQ